MGLVLCLESGRQRRNLGAREGGRLRHQPRVEGRLQRCRVWFRRMVKTPPTPSHDATPAAHPAPHLTSGNRLTVVITSALPHPTALAVAAAIFWVCPERGRERCDSVVPHRNREIAVARY